MDARLRQTVRDRAESRCEFCHLPERIAELPFQIDHVIAEQHGGLTSEDNLAFACARCNRYKGPNLSGIDPESGTITHLFNPRIDNWSEHFFWNEARLAARTAIGRATLVVLHINHPDAVNQRAALLKEGIPL
ncbi:MAG: restriction endonuclease [Acidobacteria bacterium]|nr:MAG: restriction endonuclease [Acidobacteriota bacterium]